MKRFNNILLVYDARESGQSSPIHCDPGMDRSFYADENLYVIGAPEKLFEIRYLFSNEGG